MNISKHQEALNYLKANCEQWVVNEDYRKNKKILDTTFEESDKSSELLQELVDKVPYYEELEAKATPKKPIMRDDNEYLECPNCDYPLSKTNYCEHCGQALDWSEE